MDLNSFLKFFTPEERKRIMFLDGLTKSLGASNIRNCHLIADEAIIKFIVARASHTVGAQTGKSTVASARVGYWADFEPAPIMFVQPTLNLAKRYSRQRISPLVESTPVLREKFAGNRSRDESNTTLMKDFEGGVLVMAGANSAADLRSMPVRYLLLDEVDAYPQDVDGEGDPCDLAERRQSTFARKKRVKTSTPGDEVISRIEPYYQASSRAQYHVPCPHCGGLQALKWGEAQQALLCESFKKAQ